MILSERLAGVELLELGAQREIRRKVDLLISRESSEQLEAVHSGLLGWADLAVDQGGRGADLRVRDCALVADRREGHRSRLGFHCDVMSSDHSRATARRFWRASSLSGSMSSTADAARGSLEALIW